MIGTILHERWRILSELGRGGMGEVFLAEHLTLGRQEALKILMPSVAIDPQFVSRFRREARAINRLRHPNIIAVYDFGQLPDGRFYLAMEYAPGESLLQLIRREEALSPPRALHLLGQLAYAVHHAHSRGVVHRDLKPANMIVVGDDATLKVLDFGVAKIVGADHAESVALSTGNLVMGTAKYMSPERAMGVGTDPRSDLYAIGCIAYELLIGAPPFLGNPTDVIRAQLLQQPEAPSVVRPSRQIPPELDAIVLRLLEKKPDARFQTAAELFAALTKVPGYPPPKADGRRRFVPINRHPTDAAALTPRAASEPDGYGNLRGALRAVGEALLDLGLTDPRLVSGVAYLRDHEQALARVEASQDALEHEASAVRETIEDREGSLRFAISELQYAKEGPDDTLVDQQLGELQQRLAAAIAEGQRLQTLESDITSVSEARADGLDQLKQAYDALERVVDELLPAQVHEPTIAPLAQRLALVQRARQRRTTDA